MIYLASPYSHKSPAVRAQRFDAAGSVTATLLSKGYFVYSPIVHCHELALRYNLPKDFEFWIRYNFHMLELSEELFVLNIEGMEESKGVEEEIVEARRLGKPITFVDPAEVASFPYRKGVLIDET